MDLRKAFDQFDTANNGVISYEEFKAAMKKVNYSDKDLESMFKSIVSGVKLSVEGLHLSRVPHMKPTGCQPEWSHYVY